MQCDGFMSREVLLCSFVAAKKNYGSGNSHPLTPHSQSGHIQNIQRALWAPENLLSTYISIKHPTNSHGWAIERCTHGEHILYHLSLFFFSSPLLHISSCSGCWSKQEQLLLQESPRISSSYEACLQWHIYMSFCLINIHIILICPWSIWYSFSDCSLLLNS